MEKQKIIEGVEKIKHKVHTIQTTLKNKDFDRAITNLINISLDAKYYLKHVRALKRASNKPKPFMNGLRKPTAVKKKAGTTKSIKKKPAKRKVIKRKQKSK